MPTIGEVTTPGCFAGSATATVATAGAGATAGIGGTCVPPRRHHMRDRLARDAHAQALALDLDLGEAGFVEQLGQLADQVLFAQRFARAWLRFSRLP